MPPQAPQTTRDPSTRCTVKRVEELQIDGKLQKHLVVVVDRGTEQRSVILCDDWAYTDIQPGDILSVIGEFSPINPQSSSSSAASTITITFKYNLLIHHPDLLMTATALTSVSSCARRPLLASFIRSSGSAPALVWGNILHEVFQACLTQDRWDEVSVNEMIDEVVHHDIGALLSINASVEEAKREVRTKAKGLKAFADKYIAPIPRANALLSDTRSKGSENSRLAILGSLDVEEDIWCPAYGLKGKIDATVQGIISDSSVRLPTGPTRSHTSTTLTSRPMPLEVKTGKATYTLEHRAQTILYTLLASHRYGTKVEDGLLYYTQSEEVIRVPRGWNELRALLIGRNELAKWVMKRVRASCSTKPEEQTESDSFLPPPIDDERTCKRCYTLDSCMLYRKAVEKVSDTNSPIADIYADKTGHLTPNQCEFFKKWENLIALEEYDMFRFRKELWTMGAVERERVGRAFSKMHLDNTFHATAKSGEKNHHFTYRFIRTAADVDRGTISYLNGHMCIGDAVILSAEPDLLALAKGNILGLDSHGVVLGLDRRISVDLVKSRFLGGEQEGANRGQVIFRIDKDDLSGGMGRIRDNLAQLFYVDGDKRRLELIVDLRKPRFASSEPTEPVPSMPDNLNASQRLAVSKALAAEDYALILGMPGTGKTTLVAALIGILVKMGKTILLTSYTHSAVDTILAKLVDESFPILRLGNVNKIHPAVRKFAPTFGEIPSSTEQMRHQLFSPRVVATTCLSIDHPVFSFRKFDYCIVDEASQVTLPTCLGPLRFADKFVLVGDHFQLPPLVRNANARKGGLETSLFRRLSDSHPHAVVDLTDQYRMNEDIMLLSNRLIYNNRLCCGSPMIAQQSLSLPDSSLLSRLHRFGTTKCRGNECWMERLIAESCKAVFVDTDFCPAKDSRVGDLVHNVVEATLIHQLTEFLIQAGVRQDQIGIISLYRQQNKLLSHLLLRRPEVEILTADRSQGRDKDCILISMVRSNDSGQVGDLLKDWRRINVSFTRARAKLIIFGSRTTLRAAPLLQDFFDLMDGQGWTLALPSNAHTMHPFPLTSGPITVKRVAEVTDSCTENKENSTLLRTGKVAKKPRVQSGLMRSRPMLRDVLNNQ